VSAPSRFIPVCMPLRGTITPLALSWRALVVSIAASQQSLGHLRFDRFDVVLLTFSRGVMTAPSVHWLEAVPEKRRLA